MSNSSNPVSLDWIRQYEGSLGLGSHALGDTGSLGFLARDQIAFRTYRMIHVGEPGGEGPQETKRPGFTLETVQKAECPPDAGCAFLLTENDVYFVRQDGSLIRRSSLQARHGDTFLDLKMAGADPLRTAVVLTEDRASTSYTVSFIEASETLKPVWAKTWSEAVTCISISYDGSYVAVGLENGSVVLMSRQKRVVWTNIGSDESPIRALAVDRNGNVIALDSNGMLKRHDFADGNITWRTGAQVGNLPRRSNLPASIVCTDADCSTIFTFANAVDDFAQTSCSNYLIVDGQTGNIVCDDKLGSAVIGASVCPSGRFGAISCKNGEVMLMSLAERKRRTHVTAFTSNATRDSAPELLSQANRAYNARNFTKAVELLNQVFELDPALYGAGALYDDVSWHLRQSIMAVTKEVSEESLATVDEALALLPNDEKLIIRRNALARLLAENTGHRAHVSAIECRFDEAIALYVEALKIDRSQTDLRNALRSVTDQYVLSLIKHSDAAFHEERYRDAIELLEKILELRPGETAILHRLEHAKGLRAYSTGMRHYINRRYNESAFWFRKTLSILPDHAEAARYLAFSDNFSRQGVALASNQAPAPQEVSVVGERFGMLE